MSLFSFSKFFFKKRVWLLVALVCLVFYQIISTERNAIIITEINISKDALPRKAVEKSSFDIKTNILAERKGNKKVKQFLTENEEESNVEEATDLLEEEKTAKYV